MSIRAQHQALNRIFACIGENEIMDITISLIKSQKSYGDIRGEFIESANRTDDLIRFSANDFMEYFSFFKSKWMTDIAFIPEAFKEYIDWFDAVAERIKMLIRDISLTIFLKDTVNLNHYQAIAKDIGVVWSTKKAVWYKR